MTDQNKYAIIGMFAIVITLYALKDSHTIYLPDFFGLALATTAPRPSYAIGAVMLLALIRHSYLAHGLADRVPVWLLPIALPGARDMSRSDQEYDNAEVRYKERISGYETNLEYIEIPQPVAENSTETILAAKTELAASAVITGALGLTEATRLLAGAQSGKKYQTASRRLKMEIERQQNHYPELNESKQRKPTRN